MLGITFNKGIVLNRKKLNSLVENSIDNPEKLAKEYKLHLDNQIKKMKNRQKFIWGPLGILLAILMALIFLLNSGSKPVV